jgi:hypothetical protein
MSHRIIQSQSLFLMSQSSTKQGLNVKTKTRHYFWILILVSNDDEWLQEMNIKPPCFMTIVLI